MDDLSYVCRDQAETAVLFELIAERYERNRLRLRSNFKKNAKRRLAYQKRGRIKPYGAFSE
ncbi:MAG TPA: hypothetical protein VNF68_11640, partial [Candidatus Baltobacteraceae bacterium]|nr:hypothetical protein [Candidatus Baltobacteraceae bacterium]